MFICPLVLATLPFSLLYTIKVVQVGISSGRDIRYDACKIMQMARKTSHKFESILHYEI